MNYDPSTFSERFVTRQAELHNFNSLAAKWEKTSNLLKQKTTWINTAKHPLKDKRTGIVVKPNTIYAGFDEIPVPDYQWPVLDLEKYKKSQDVVLQGESASSTEIDNALFNPFHKEFHEPLKLYNDVILGSESAAGIHTSQDFALINNIGIAGQLIIQQQTVFPILNAVRTENTTSLIFRQYRATGFDIDAQVGELQTTEPRKVAFSKEEFYTRKSGGEIQWSDEHLMNEYLFNPLDIARGQFPIGADKIIANKIAKTIASATTVTGDNVEAFTGEHNTYNPYKKLAAVRTTINLTNFGNLNRGLCNSTTFFSIISNTYIKGVPNTQPLGGLAQGDTVQIPGFPGVSIIIDESIADGKLYLFDSDKAITRIQGPIRTEQYRLAREGGNGLVYRNWNDVQFRDPTKMRVITSLI